MKKHITIFAIALACAFLFLTAKTGLVANASYKYSHANIVVTGEAEIKSAPDAALISFSVETTHESLSEAEKQSRELVDKIITSLNEFEIEKSNIKTEGFYAYKKYNYEERTEKFIGYSVYNTISVQVTNLENVQNIVSAIAANGATSFNSLNYYKQDTSQLYNTALETALKRAKEKALLLTESQNIYLLKVIEENTSHFHSCKMSAFPLENQDFLYDGEIIVTAKVKALYSTTKPSETAMPSLYENSPITSNKLFSGKTLANKPNFYESDYIEDNTFEQHTSQIKSFSQAENSQNSLQDSLKENVALTNPSETQEKTIHKIVPKEQPKKSVQSDNENRINNISVPDITPEPHQHNSLSQEKELSMQKVHNEQIEPSVQENTLQKELNADNYLDMQKNDMQENDMQLGINEQGDTSEKEEAVIDGYEIRTNAPYIPISV